ncbi:MAG: aromatic-ring-hydroxylating dioxygenase subunit beta, partial [Burkholderiaceae bacterium]
MSAAAPSDDINLWFRVQAFLTAEARLLDDHALDAWLDLFSDDLRYWMPTITNRIGRDVDKSVSAFGQEAHFDDNKTSLT